MLVVRDLFVPITRVDKSIVSVEVPLYSEVSPLEPDDPADPLDPLDPDNPEEPDDPDPPDDNTQDPLILTY